MRAIVQRVMQASVTVDESLVSSIGKGICVLVGINRDDTQKDLDYIVRKVLNLRVFEDDQGKRWSKSVMDQQLEVLCVSQFTLYSILKGNKPDFHSSMGGEDSRIFYEQFVQRMKESYKPELIKDGAFGAYMQVHIQNDGPVTIDIESPTKNEADCKQKKPTNQGKQKAKQPCMAGSVSAAPPGGDAVTHSPDGAANSANQDSTVSTSHGNDNSNTLEKDTTDKLNIS